jgi:hypothetical protein
MIWNARAEGAEIADACETARYKNQHDAKRER